MIDFNDWIGLVGAIGFSVVIAILLIRNANQRFSGQLNGLKQSSQEMLLQSLNARKIVESVRSNFQEHFSEMESFLLSDSWEKPESRRVQGKPSGKTSSIATWKPLPAAPSRHSITPLPESGDFRPETRAVEWGGAQRYWKQMIESKATGRLNEEKLLELEKRMESMLKRYESKEPHLKPKPLQRIDSAGLDPERLLHSMTNLLSLLDLEKRSQQWQQDGNEKERAETVEPAGKHSMEEVKAIAIELQKHRIITELDKIIELVRSNEKLPVSSIAQSLNISKGAAMELCEMLDKNDLVVLHYPPFGEPIVYDLPFAPGAQRHGKA